jgi:hypothetical protein
MIWSQKNIDVGIESLSCKVEFHEDGLIFLF